MRGLTEGMTWKKLQGSGVSGFTLCPSPEEEAPTPGTQTREEKPPREGDSI